MSAGESLDWCKKLIHGVGSVPLEIVVRLGEVRQVPNALFNKKVGDQIVLNQRVDQELSVLVQGVPRFSGVFGQVGSRRAIRITKDLSEGSMKESDFLSDSTTLQALESVVDLPLSVHVEFGRARISIGDVLQLRKGSVLELSENVDEPLRIIVNGRPFASGEMVSADGRFGVRVVEVLSQCDDGGVSHEASK